MFENEKADAANIGIRNPSSFSGDSGVRVFNDRHVTSIRQLSFKLRRHAIYCFLVREYLALWEHTQSELINVWQLDEKQLYRLGIVCVPTEIHNLFACHAIAKKFGALFDIEGFYLLRDCWRLDIDERLARCGLILPVRDSEGRFIIELKILRHLCDEKPFILRTRTERKAAK